jgi:hypothetical protein
MISTLLGMGILLSLVVLCYIMYKKYKRSNNVALRQKMTRVWFDHVDRTAQYIIAALAGLPSVDAIAGHLQENQNDIGMLMSKYYGRDAGSKLAELLHKHIDIAAAIVSAAKDKKPLDDLSKQWSVNADEISEFLSGINPREWSLDEIKKMMTDHLTETSKYLQLLVSDDWAGAAKQHDVVVDQAQYMANMLSSGIIKQFS